MSYSFQPKFLTRCTRFVSVTDDMPEFTCEPGRGIEIAIPHERAFRLYRYAPVGY